MIPSARQTDHAELATRIKQWGAELGFQQVGISATELGSDEAHLLAWLAANRHGEMGYMQRHGTRRSRPADLRPGTLRVISARMNYDPPRARDAWDVLDDATLGYVSRYALGRDYHKVLRARLQKLAERIEDEIGPFPSYRAFVDSAPVLEKALFARNAGLGWIGKHTNLLSRDAGSWFFLGELYTDLPLPVDEPASEHCGTCTRCIDVCPDASDRRAERTPGRTALHFLSDDRVARQHSARIPSAARQPHLWLRRLPARLPLEQVREEKRRARLHRTPRARQLVADRPVRMERAR